MGLEDLLKLGRVSYKFTAKRESQRVGGRTYTYVSLAWGESGDSGDNQVLEVECVEGVV